MIRKLLLPAVAIALLGGCMTSGYSYRQDRGDYYYGQPSTEYRYHGSPYGGYGGYGGYYDRYGYPGYGRYPYGYGGYFHHPYYYSPYNNGYPYYPYRPRPPVVVVPRPGDNTPPPPRPDDSDRNNGDRRPPWRDFRPVNRDGVSDVEPRRSVPIGAGVTAPPPRAEVVRPRNDGGSRSEQVIRRARSKAIDRESDK